jgi:hypothetical protein
MVLRKPLSSLLRNSSGSRIRHRFYYHQSAMAFPIKVCAVCGEEFELKPDKPGFANRCPDCSTPDSLDPATKQPTDAFDPGTKSEVNAARRQAMRDLLYRKDS